jgi:DNA-binding PadR family transcriptional regulator
MAKRRKVGNLLAMAVLATLAERPMHPYEIASVLRRRGKEQSIQINWGSLYTVVQNLEKHGFIEVSGTDRRGNRPERRIFRITKAGREEVEDWMRELIGVPEKEYPRFEAALSMAGLLPPDEVLRLLEQRLLVLDKTAADEQQMLAEVSETLPRVFLVEGEYHVAMVKAEADWIRSLIKEIQDGTLSGLSGWRSYHETGKVPAEFADLESEEDELDQHSTTSAPTNSASYPKKTIKEGKRPRK